ncbi:MAG: LysR family transcriptional regulator [Sulfuritalea sp.]|nr:LysR family transcriptional regulator [Sulfuritalea sp.]
MNTDRFSWDLARSFLAALNQGSLLSAARQLKTSQPTVGRHIAELESQLGLVLFERTGRGLKPTAVGLRLADAARSMEASALELARLATGTKVSETGTVRISASQPVACYMLPPILRAMQEALPHIQVELVSSNAVSNLLRREADLAVRMVRPEQASLIARRIGNVGVGAYASRDYLRRNGTPDKPQDLLQHRLVGYDQNEDILRGFARLGTPITQEAFDLRSDDLIVQWEAVRAGLGIGFAADYVAAADPDIVAVVPSLKIPTLPVWLVVHREIRTNKLIRAVFDFLAEAIAQRLEPGTQNALADR